MKNKFIIRLVFFMILLISVCCYIVGYIPLIGKVIAENKINDYVKNIYGEDKHITMNYDFYNMGNYSGGEYYIYDLRSNEIIDLQLYENAKGATLYKQDYQKIIKNLGAGIYIKDFYISCRIDANDFSKKYYRLTIYDMGDTNTLSNDESIKRPAKIVMKFIKQMEIQYNFTSVVVHYTDNNGNYTISYDSKIPITEQILINNTKKL